MRLSGIIVCVNTGFDCVLRAAHLTTQVNIAVSGINIGPVHKRDVMRANVMNEKGSKKYAVILAFDVPVSREARDMAQGTCFSFPVLVCLEFLAFQAAAAPTASERNSKNMYMCGA
jgi:hypothetical protein